MTRSFICPLCLRPFPVLKEYLDHLKERHKDYDGRTPFPVDKGQK